MLASMRLVLAATDAALADAWGTACGSLPNVSVHRGSILDLEVDALVSPANSFGFMDGGIDGVYRRHFGGHIQERLQALLRAQHDGELPVGMAEIIATDHPRLHYLVAAPTMRVPMSIAGTLHAYLAARAVFRLVKQGSFAPGSGGEGRVSSRVASLAMPGLGTGVGGVPPETCARQVRLAYEQTILGRVPRYASLADALHAHLQASR
jgi:O-acetyl-ADP-ribose deacetylase (regulator of RNase III)